MPSVLGIERSHVTVAQGVWEQGGQQYERVKEVKSASLRRAVEGVVRTVSKKGGC